MLADVLVSALTALAVGVPLAIVTWIALGNAGVKQRAKKLAEQTKRIDELESEVEQWWINLRKADDSLTSYHRSVNQQNDAHKRQISNHAERLTEIEGRLAQHEQVLERLNGRVNDVVITQCQEKQDAVEFLRSFKSHTREMAKVMHAMANATKTGDCMQYPNTKVSADNTEEGNA